VLFFEHFYFSTANFVTKILILPHAEHSVMACPKPDCTSNRLLLATDVAVLLRYCLAAWFDAHQCYGLLFTYVFGSLRNLTDNIVSLQKVLNFYTVKKHVVTPKNRNVSNYLSVFGFFW